MAESTYSGLRILPFSRNAGAYQLAATEAVIDAVGAGHAPPTLRMYSWASDAIVLGAGQPASQLDVAACHQAGCEILRRLSGGTAVFHDGNTVSFQLVLPRGHPYLSDDIHLNYRRIADIVLSMLARLGVEARSVSLAEARQDESPSGLDAICFSSLAPYEIVAGGRKLVGLAQVRRRTVSALQGMLYLRADAATSVRLVSHRPELQLALSTVLADRMTDLLTVTKREISADEVSARFAVAALDAMRIQPVESSFTRWEVGRARELERVRYGNPAWTFRS